MPTIRGNRQPSSTAVGAAALGVGGLLVAATAWSSTDGGEVAAQTAPFNPVAPADGFLIVTEGDAHFAADESEGPAAIGGDVSIDGTYNIMLGGGSTPTAPGDDTPISLLIGGAFDTANSSGVLTTLGGGFIKLGDPTGVDVLDEDMNGAPMNVRIVPAGADENAVPAIRSDTMQSAASVLEPVPSDTFDFAAAFAEFRNASAALAPCQNTVQLLDSDDQPIADNEVTSAGTPVRVELDGSMQNVLNVSATSLDNISEISFITPPSQTGPLIVNVDTSDVGGNFSWTPEQTGAGISGTQAPFILWNFPGATTLTMDAPGDTIEGTIFAPNADVTLSTGSNIEGNVIAQTFTHLLPGVGADPGNGVREIHDFPFDALLTPCAAPPPTTTAAPTTAAPTTAAPTTAAPTTAAPTTAAPTTAAPTTAPPITVSPTVAPTVSSTIPDILPATGSDSEGPLAWIAMLTLLAGAALVVVARRDPAGHRS